MSRDYSRRHSPYVVPDDEIEQSSPEKREISLISEQAEIINHFFETPAPTLVLGGAGTGKTLVAIHMLSNYRESNPECLAMYFTQSFELREKSKKDFEKRTHGNDDSHVEFFNIIDYCMKYLGLDIHRDSYVDFDRFLHEDKLVDFCKQEKIDPIDVWTEIRGTIKGAMSRDWTHHKEYISQDGYENIKEYVDEGLLVRNPDNLKYIRIKEGVDEEKINQKNDKQLIKLWNYFSTFDPDKRMLEDDEYEKLPDENATLPKEKRKAVLRICKEYDQYLQDHKLFDDNDLVREMFRSKKGLPSVDLVVVDEIQDYTELQIYLLYCIASDKTKIAFVGDNHQNVNPTYFSVSRLESLFRTQEKNNPLHLEHLTGNFRCPQEIIKRTNKLSELRRSTIAKMSDELEQPETSRKNSQSSVTRLSFSDKNFTDLYEESTNYPGVVILVPDKETKKDLKQRVGKDLDNKQDVDNIFTVAEIKGMEYSYVIAYNLIGKYCQIWDEMLSPDFPKKQTKYRYYFNLLYVAMSRTQLHLCFIDERSSDKLENELDLTHHDSFSAGELRFIDLDQSEKAWIEYAKQLEENGLYEEAIGKYREGHADEKNIFRCRMRIADKNREYEKAIKYCILSDAGAEEGKQILKVLSDGDFKEIGNLYVALCEGSHVITKSCPSFYIQTISDDQHEIDLAEQVFLRHYSTVTEKTINSIIQTIGGAK